MRCVYCNRDVPDNTITDEHVLPKKIGGGLQPTNPFLLHAVCARCNSNCGNFVDAPYLKSWIVHNHGSEIARRTTPIDGSTILPLSCMGPVPALSFGKKICDLWLGPCGDTVYHFHDPYPQDVDVPIGVGLAPHLRNNHFDPGFVFILVATNNPVWASVLINSCFDEFEGSTFYLGNGPTPQGNRPNGDHFSDIPPELNELRDQIFSMRGQEHTVRLAISLIAQDRFLAKTALGFGALFLDSSFRTSASADLLRTAMWTRRAVDRETIPLPGARNFGFQNDNIRELLTFNDCHVVGLLPSDGRLLLFLSIYGVELFLVQITNDITHWRTLIGAAGRFYIVARGIRSWVGPKDLTDIVRHKSGQPDAAIANLEMSLRTLPPRPPCRIENSPLDRQPTP